MLSAWWLCLIVLAVFIAGFMTCTLFVVGKDK